MAKIITKEEVQRKGGDKIKLVDIRSIGEYEKMHIPGAINIPAEKLVEELKAFNTKDIIVCICNYGKERGQQAAEIVCNAGFRNSFYLQGGTMGWFDFNKAEPDDTGQK